MKRAPELSQFAMSRRMFVTTFSVVTGTATLIRPGATRAQVASFSTTVLDPLDGYPDLQPVGISDDGTIVLNASNDQGTVVYGWQSGTYHRLGGDSARATASTINDGGVIAGWTTSSATGTPVAGELPVLITEDHLVYMPGDSTDAKALAADSEGNVVGYQLDSNGASIPVLWSETDRTALAIPDGFNSGSARGINIIAQIVGWAGTEDSGVHQAVIWADSKPTTIDGLEGGASEATAINDNGIVVGPVTTSPDAIRFDEDNTVAFRWDGEQATTLPSLDGAIGHLPIDLNATEMIVGQATMDNGETIAVIWSSGDINDLNSMVDDSTHRLTSAVSVNRYGSILCAALDQSAVPQIVLLDIIGN